ncbi:MAG: site-specific DNA-methyltransferase [Candidatus Omnitrophica bacterium]|nr:site-specific DNA-methyltransferase [Candidatus Omnitrophota bacterium]
MVEKTMGIKPYFETKLGKLYCGGCLEIMPELEPIDLVLTDPPYPNNANHFNKSIADARKLISIITKPLMTFWTEVEIPKNKNPLIAVHIWHRSNTNRPDNYESIFYFNPDGKKRASRILSYPVVCVGLTGCVEATGHPTQKKVGLIAELIKLSKIDGLICDPFIGSGTTAIACERLNRKWIGIEKEEKYCEIAAKRIEQETSQLKLFR